MLTPSMYFLGRNLALEAEMAQLQQSTAEGHKVAMELQMTLEERLQQQQDALWVSEMEKTRPSIILYCISE